MHECAHGMARACVQEQVCGHTWGHRSQEVSVWVEPSLVQAVRLGGRGRMLALSPVTNAALGTFTSGLG